MISESDLPFVAADCQQDFYTRFFKIRAVQDTSARFARCCEVVMHVIHTVYVCEGKVEEWAEDTR